MFLVFRFYIFISDFRKKFMRKMFRIEEFIEGKKMWVLFFFKVCVYVVRFVLFMVGGGLFRVFCNVRSVLD